MPFSKQLSDARSSSIRNISGACASSAQFAQQINDVTEQLLKRGSWFGTDIVAKFCFQGCSVTFPRHIEAVLGLRSCGAQIPVKNNWYAIVGSASCCSPWDIGGNSVMRDEGLFPCYNEVTGTTGKKIAYHVVKNSDIGKTIRVFGTKYGGQPLQEKNADGIWVSGITITATAASIVLNADGTINEGASTLPAMSSDLVTKITHISREATQGMTYLYEYDPVEITLRDLALYEPNETVPQYRRYRIENAAGIPCYTDSYGRKMRTVEALVKLKFIPVVNDWDFLMIDDFQALKYGIQAYNRDEAGDVEGAEAFWTKAIRELNMAERSKNPADSLSVKVRVMGSSRIITNPI